MLKRKNFLHETGNDHVLLMADTGDILLQMLNCCLMIVIPFLVPGEPMLWC
ncbi:hypothetical protein [Klebsiella aerogenes]|uniref:Uncharacterized protein n=1 Tax=Klebsiella aerogenes TaxID=548 RepID=A0AAP9U6U1_KLEAE|nr:hypothetical protein [Klebsiella aerogenes]QMR41555.1 hypothetical protein HV331_19545 [Klebsiella aerogenes]